MTNIITFQAPPRLQPFHAQAKELIALFSQNRRGTGDVFWLKENAELLSILECTGARPDNAALEPMLSFYESLPDRLSFFPQYYRFLLSICLDIEDLGHSGQMAERLCGWVKTQNLVAAEMSDLQRAEAQRLLARRNSHIADPALDARLRSFIGHSDTFAVPNKKASYELTHIVFYLSEYGRADPCLDQGAVQSLHFAGILAYLDQNADLLAEVCIALRYAGQQPSPIWEDWVRACLHSFEVHANVQDDQYHEYFVSHWMACSAQKPVLTPSVGDGFARFVRPDSKAGPLRHISACMYQMKSARSGDWSKMQAALGRNIDQQGYEILDAARQSSPEFEAFFEGFSRISIAV